MEKKRNLWLIPTDKPSRLIYNNRLKSFCFQKEKDGMYINDGKVSSANFWSIEKAQNNGFQPQNIYITDDSKIQEGDYGIGFAHGIQGVGRGYFVFKQDGTNSGKLNALCEGSKKVIITDNPDLIKDSVQEISEDFIEWFVKNPSCESVRVNNLCYGALGGFADAGYKIIIPQELPKQKYKYIGECNGNNQNGCFLDSPGHDCGCFTRVVKDEPEQVSLEEIAKKYAIDVNVKRGGNKEAYQNCSRLDFITGAKSDAAREYWFEKFQQEQDKNMYSDEEVFNLWNWLNDGFIIRKSLPTKEELLGWFKQFKNK
jgi:hypothetical protein